MTLSWLLDADEQMEIILSFIVIQGLSKMALYVAAAISFLACFCLVKLYVCL